MKSIKRNGESKALLSVCKQHDFGGPCKNGVEYDAIYVKDDLTYLRTACLNAAKEVRRATDNPI
jgi:hypothetical protein